MTSDYLIRVIWSSKTKMSIESDVADEVETPGKSTLYLCSIQ